MAQDKTFYSNIFFNARILAWNIRLYVKKKDMQELDTSFAIVGWCYLYRVLLSFLTVMMWSSMGKRYPWQHNKLAKWTASRSWQNWKLDWSHEIQSAPKNCKDCHYVIIILSFCTLHTWYHYYLINAPIIVMIDL